MPGGGTLTLQAARRRGGRSRLDVHGHRARRAPSALRIQHLRAVLHDRSRRAERAWASPSPAACCAAAAATSSTGRGGRGACFRVVLPAAGEARHERPATACWSPRTRPRSASPWPASWRSAATRCKVCPTRQGRAQGARRAGVGRAAARPEAARRGRASTSWPGCARSTPSCRRSSSPASPTCSPRSRPCASGAFDYLTKPPELRGARACAWRRRARRRCSSARTAGCASRCSAGLASDILTRSPALQKVLRTLEMVAAARTPVLIEGESGVGKELLAQHLHRLSPRAEQGLRGPQLRGGAVDAAGERALRPRARRLHGRGQREARAGGGGGRRHAVPRRGRGDGGRRSSRSSCACSTAARSTAWAPPASGAPTSAWWRPPTATSQAEVAAGRFRKDLFYRINGVQGGDPAAARAAGGRSAARRALLARGCPNPKRFSAAALAALAAYDWPGNVRELHFAVERAGLLGGGRDASTCDDLPPGDPRADGPRVRSADPAPRPPPSARRRRTTGSRTIGRRRRPAPTPRACARRSRRRSGAARRRRRSWASRRGRSTAGSRGWGCSSQAGGWPSAASPRGSAPTEQRSSVSPEPG